MIKNLMIIQVCILVSNISIRAQEKLYSIEENLISKKIKICIPNNYNKDTFNYDEGVYISYTYRDLSNITIFEGSMVRLPLLNENEGFVIEKTDTIQSKISYTGNLNNKYWREDAYKTIRVYYKNVNEEKKYLFDLILDSLCFCSMKD